MFLAFCLFARRIFFIILLTSNFFIGIVAEYKGNNNNTHEAENIQAASLLIVSKVLQIARLKSGARASRLD